MDTLFQWLLEKISVTHIINIALGFLLGRFWVSVKTRYYLKMSDAIIKANQNLKTDRDKWKDLAERTDRLNQELRKQLTIAIKAREDAEADSKITKKLYQEMSEHQEVLVLALLNGGIKIPRTKWVDEVIKKQEG